MLQGSPCKPTPLIMLQTFLITESKLIIQKEVQFIRIILCCGHHNLVQGSVIDYMKKKTTTTKQQTFYSLLISDGNQC